jgi:hypothetical protein
VGGELAGQACPLLKVGEQFSGHLDPGWEELAEQLGRKHPARAGRPGTLEGGRQPGGHGDLPGGTLARGPLVNARPDPVELAVTAQLYKRGA